jgi:hypothetical protein
VLAQTAVVGLRLASLGQVHRLSLSLCAASDERYRRLAVAVGSAAACILPAPLGGALLDWQARRLSGGAAFLAVHAALLVCVACCLVLLLLHRWEWRRRQTFARQRRLAAEARGLLAQRDRWHVAAPAVLLCSAALWWLCALCGACLPTLETASI